MSDLIIKSIVNDMTWSYSRISTFDDCPYRWFLKYIRDYNEFPMFYASYGGFMHEIIEDYYRGNTDSTSMLSRFLVNFQDKVQGERPSEKIVQNYIKKGVDYLRDFQPLPFPIMDVEKRIDFSINNYKFVGFIDLLAEKDGELYIIDNKSRDLKPRSKRKKPTIKDMELSTMLRQLYLYSAGIQQEMGVFPKALCFNCFKSKQLIVEEFNPEDYERSIQWALETIEEIGEEEEFKPRPDFFKCKYICGVNHECCYCDMSRG